MFQSGPAEALNQLIAASEEQARSSHFFSWCKCGHLVMGPGEEVLQPRRVPEKDLKNGGYVQPTGAGNNQQKSNTVGVLYPCMPVLRCPWCGAFCKIEDTRTPVTRPVFLERATINNDKSKDNTDLVVKTADKEAR